MGCIGKRFDILSGGPPKMTTRKTAHQRAGRVGHAPATEGASMTITHYYSPARALLSGTGARHHHILGGTLGRVSGSSLGFVAVPLTLPWHGHANCGRTKRHPQPQGGSPSSQSKHGPLIVRGSFAMIHLAPKRQPARCHSERCGDLFNRGQRRLCLPMLPLAHVFARVRWVKCRPDRALRHVRGLAGCAEAVG